MKVLLFGDGSSVFIHSLYKNLKARNIDVKVSSPHLGSARKFDYRKEDILYYPAGCSSAKNKIMCILNEMRIMKEHINITKPDIIHYHSLQPRYAFTIKHALKMGSKIITTIWGSDMYGIEKLGKFKGKIFKSIQRRILDKADLITVPHKAMKDDLLKIYGRVYENKVRHARFGMPVDLKLIDNINPKNFMRKYNIPGNKLIIVAGTKSDPLGNHFYIIDELLNISGNIRDRIFIIVPLTYGDENYKQIILNRYARIKSILFLTKFISFEDIAALRKITDIFVFLPKTDAFSAALQESLYANNIVITGSWLPYNLLDEENVFYLKLDRIAEGHLRNIIEDIIINLGNYKDKVKMNKNKIWKIASWEENIRSWLKLYEEVLEI